MKWRRHIGKLSHEELRTLAALCAAMGLLVIAAVAVTPVPQDTQAASISIGGQTYCWNWPPTNCATPTYACSASFSPSTVPAGNSAVFSWQKSGGQAYSSTQYVVDLTNNRWIGQGHTDGGSVSIAPTSQTDVGFCYLNSGDPNSSSASWGCWCGARVSIGSAPPPPTSSDRFSLTAEPASVSYGNGSRLRWRANIPVQYCVLGGGAWGSGTRLSDPNDTDPTGALYQTTEYWYQCRDASAWQEIVRATVQVTGIPQPPTVTISGPSSLAVGQQGTIVANFVAGSNDSLVRTAINDASQNAVTPWTPPGGKSYAFTPTASGTYTFYPAVQTSQFPSWNNYGKSHTVTVTSPLCGANEVGTYPNCQCAAGYQRDASGTCAAVPTCSGANEVNPPSCTCEVGYVRTGGVCTVAQCTGANEVNPPACTCGPGYERAGGACIRQALLSVTLDGAPAARVRRGTPVALSWNASGVQDGSCTVRANGGSALSSSASGSLAPAVSAQTIYRLTCLNDAGSAVSAEATAYLIPDFSER